MMNQLVAACLREAVATAQNEAKITPIKIGTAVGHTDFATYGTKTCGTLTAYEDDEALIETSPGEITRWKTEGMSDIKRVYILAEEYMVRLIEVLQFVKTLNKMGMPLEVAMMLSLAPSDDPTPGCNCEYCHQFTSEQQQSTIEKSEFPFNAFLSQFAKN